MKKYVNHVEYEKNAQIGRKTLYINYTDFYVICALQDIK